MPLPPTRRLLAAAAATVTVALTAAGCGGSSGAATEDGKTVVRYQSYLGTVNLPELADALGYYDGTSVELKRLGDVQGGPESLRALATDQVDYSAAFLGAIAKLESTGAPIQTVVAYYGSDETVNSSLLVRKGDGIEGPRDLIGKKIAVNTLGANAEAIIDTYLADGGLSQDEIEQVTLVPLPPATSESSLREKQVDAVYLNGTFREVALQRPGLEVLVDDIDVVGPYNGGGISLRDQWVAANPEATEEFVAGMAKAVAWAQDHSAKEVVDTVSTYLEEDGRGEQADALAYWKGLGISSKGGTLADGDFDVWLDWLEANGEIDAGAVDVGDLYTNEFNPYAKEG
jgi:ABC-type nitrate/sulfonate/bicarbonate transport system substrate-binding protein